MDGTTEELYLMAKSYAVRTTCTRCARLGDCKGCDIKFCDYKSRYESFIAGATPLGCRVDCKNRKPF